MSGALVPAAGGRRADAPGFATRFVVEGATTGGAFALVEHELAPRSIGAPLHTHEREDEISHVLAGRLGAEVGGEVVEAGAGDTIVKPRGVPHAFWNPGDEPVRFLELITPAGFEEYFAGLAAILGTGGPPDLAALGALQERYALTMDLGSMGRIVAEHGLDAPPGAPA